MVYSPKRERRQMVLYDGEEEIVEKVEKYFDGIVMDGLRSSELLKKKRELFHFFTFLKLSEGDRMSSCESELFLPDDGEGADVELIGLEKRAIEITECLDDTDKRHMLFREAVDSLFVGGKSNYTGGSLADGLTESFGEVTAKKIKKIQRYKKEGFRTELLIVTDTAYDNCPITGTWVEKFLNESFVNSVSAAFDEVHVLVYHASGKDGGPVIRELPKDYRSFQALEKNWLS